MKNILLTCAFVAVTVPALAQSQDHQQHHPGGVGSTQAPSSTQPVTPPSTSPAQAQGQMPTGATMQGMRGVMHGSPSQGPAGASAGMTMNCPMMQGGMAGMMGGRSMGGISGAAAQRGADQSVPSLALRAVNGKMHRDMAVELTGNVDADFAKSMIGHHQGAIDMAKIALAFGRDPRNSQTRRGGCPRPGERNHFHARVACPAVKLTI